MDITANNFHEALQSVKLAVDSADFISVDTEMTGLRNGGASSAVTAYDTPSQYYQKLREGSLDFLIIQVGICTFRFDTSEQKYVYSPFNFYVFPPSSISNINFLCQSSSVDFLCKANFDFNKLFKEGIPYLSINQQQALLQELRVKKDADAAAAAAKIPIPEHLISEVDDICEQIKTFLSAAAAEKEIHFERCNSGLMRKLVYQTAYERFPTEQFYLSTEFINNNIVMVARKGKSRIEYIREGFLKQENEIEEAVGFSKLAKYISDSKKLIVGHNMLLDVCHIINRFFWPLPQSYTEFKEMVHQIFPRLIDTKYMCNAHPFKNLIPSSVLGHMVQTLDQHPFRFPQVVPANIKYSYSVEDKNKAHEAGYDAYITGLSFLALYTYLDKNSNQVTASKLNTDHLKPYLNKLFLMRIMDYSFINLTGDEPKPCRKNVFYVSFPKEWKTNDIIQLFAPYGNVHVSYCNDVSAWITLLDKNKSQLVVSKLIKEQQQETANSCASLLRKSYTIITWDEYYKNNLLLSATADTRNIRNANDHVCVNMTAGNANTRTREVSQKRSAAAEEHEMATRKKKCVPGNGTAAASSSLPSRSGGSGTMADFSVLHSAQRERKDKRNRDNDSPLQNVRVLFEEPTWDE